MTEQPISEAFYLIVELAAALGVSRICDLPGCWVHTFDNWTIAVNGHREPCDYDGVSVPPFAAFVRWGDFPAGFIGPHDGILAMGAAANEATLIEALQRAIEQAAEKTA